MPSIRSSHARGTRPPRYHTGLDCDFASEREGEMGTKCRGGRDKCPNMVGDYKDVDGVGCCEDCDREVDENPYDPYWEQMANEFEGSPEYQELQRLNLVDDSDAYELAYSKYQRNYEPWPQMRRRMAREERERETRK